MYFSKIKIKNFKSLRDTTIYFNKELNIFTGVNNSGKTTILEAISLWSEIFRRVITQSQKSNKTLDIKKGDYRLGYSTGAKQTYFDYRNIESIRTTTYEDIFYNLDYEDKIELIMSISNGNESIDIGFIIESASGSNYKIYLNNYKDFDYRYFNDFFENLPNSIKTIFASPISSLAVLEEFKTQVQIDDKIIKRESAQVLKNRIYNLEEFEYRKFIYHLEFILYNSQDSIDLITTSNNTKDTHINYDITMGSKDIAKNLSLVGSGTLQIIELLLAFYESKGELNIVLLDEPDSHIHRDIQNRLFYTLANFSKDIQIFVSTHNESLIRSSKPQQIFHLEKTREKKIYKPIIFDEPVYVKDGLIPSRHLKVLQDLGNESALDFINALESDRLIFVEGKYDPKYIQFILDKYIDIGDKPYISYWSFEGIDNIFKHIFSYKEIFSKIRNKKSLWEKSILIFDRDYLSDKQASNLEKELRKKLDIPVHIWNFYTIESVYLTNLDIFGEILFKIISRNNNSINQNDINKSLELEIENIAKEKLSQLDNLLKGKIFKWIKDKQNLFERSGLSNSILSEREAWADIKEYHKDRLEKNKIDSLATKDDIEQIIKNIVIKYKVELEVSSYFELVLSEVDKYKYWFEEWNSMRSKIYE